MSLRVADIVVDRRNRRVLGPVEFILEPGSWLSILGANGAGKSTLLRVIAGAERASAGEVVWRNRSISEMASSERAKHVAYLAQAGSTQFPFSVREYVLLGAIPHQRTEETHEGVFVGVVSAMGLEGLLDRSILQLSGGEFQRVRLTRALIQIWPHKEEGVLLLDEPLTSLDWKHQEQLLLLLRRLVDQGLTVIDATHQYLLMPSHDDRVLVLNPQGICLGVGRPSEMLTPDFIQAAFELGEGSLFKPLIKF